jgi:hypothetical protein
MTRLFQREAALEVGGVDVSGLRCSFRIERTYRSVPSSLALKVYNLSEATRNAMLSAAQERARSVPVTPGIPRPRLLVHVTLTAGYQGAMQRLFYGELGRLKHTVEGVDNVTNVWAIMGGLNLQYARVSQSFPRGATPETVAKHLADCMGLPTGSSVSLLRNARMGRDFARYSLGVTLSGSAAHELDMLTASAGLEWHVDDGRVEFVKRFGTQREAAVLLTPDTGLIGSPTKEGYYVVKGRCLLQPDVKPGKLVRVESRFVTTTLRVYKTTTVGDTHGSDWYIDFEGAPPRPPFATRVIPP